MRKRLAQALAAILLLLVVLVFAVYVYFRRSLPDTNGTLTVAGLSGAVDIVRDADAITHVFASNRRDAFFGLGYAHAQDRLWQMEFQRRVGGARLSELFGQATVATDRFLRTVGVNRAARTAWEATPADARPPIEAYVAGVNAFIATHHGSALPPEFMLLRAEPQPWTPVDVFAWVKMMAWDLSKNYTTEVFRHDLEQRVGIEKAAQLMPPYPPDGLTILSGLDLTASMRDLTTQNDVRARLRDGRQAVPYQPADERFASAWSDAFGTGVPELVSHGLAGAMGSNNWVVDGTRSATGKPLLANDPHLGAQIPSLWYLAHLSGGSLDVIGATLPGVPAVAIGRNRAIAWGETNVAVDVQDLYRERLNDQGTAALFKGTWEPLRTITERIEVKGGSPVDVVVRISRHGPLVSDAINANNAEAGRMGKIPLEPLAFRWTALDSDDTTVAAFLKLNDARNWPEFTGALRLFVVPSQNFVYADVEGHIGYYAPGRMPIRAGGDGASPADGSAGTDEWIGWIPFEELPHTFDPPKHVIVTANNRPVPADYRFPIFGEWTEPNRAGRITALLQQHEKHTPETFAAMQADTFSSHARAFVPLLLEHVVPKGAQEEKAIAELRGWNFDARGDLVAPTIFQAWLLELVDAIVGDDLGPDLTRDYTALERTSYFTRFLTAVVADHENPWCDDRRTPTVRETCFDAASRALSRAIERLEKIFGNDMSTWRWDAVHRATFAHNPFDSVRWLRPFFSRSFPHGGDWSTVNVGPVFTPKPFEQHSIPGYRQIVDLSAGNDSRFLDAVGQSGHPLSDHYDDRLEDWGAVRHQKMRMERKDIDAGAIGTLRLVPDAAH